MDYSFYVEEYLGSKIPGESFSQYEKRALAYLKMAAPLAAGQPDRYEVKMALCAVADVLYTDEQSGSEYGITSATNDGISVTYATAKSTSQRSYDALALYLSGTGLLYRGVKMRGC